MENKNWKNHDSKFRIFDKIPLLYKFIYIFESFHNQIYCECPKEKKEKNKERQ